MPANLNNKILKNPYVTISGNILAYFSYLTRASTDFSPMCRVRLAIKFTSSKFKPLTCLFLFFHVRLPI